MYRDKEKFIMQVEKVRREMHERIDREFDNFLLRLDSGKPEESFSEPVSIQHTLPLHAPPSLFKGQKPVSIEFADGRTVDVPTWKKAVVTIMRECDSDPVMHDRLMSIREKVMGKQRTILSASPDGMDAPLKIGDELYMEGKYDTETLIHVTTNRILRAVGFDYSNINITIQHPQLTHTPQEQEEPELAERGHASMEMQM